MSNIKIGDKVRYTGNRNRTHFPIFYPEHGTIGRVIEVSTDDYFFIQWPIGSTSGNGRWYVVFEEIEKVEEQEVTEE